MRRLTLPLMALGFGGACAAESQSVFHPSGEGAADINRLQVWVFGAAGVVGVIVAALIIYCLVRFRRRANDEESPEPIQVHGNLRLEIGWTIVPALILSVVAAATMVSLFNLSERPNDATHIKVFGQQWWWSYEYDLDDDGESEIVTANDLVIPVDREVVLDLTSRDVIHSFWIPSLAGTKDVVPGRWHELPIQASRPGVYEGQCKEFCGLSHANMRARVVAVEEDEFEQWVDEQRDAAKVPSDPVAVEGKKQFETLLCAQCHQIRGVNDGLEVSRDLLVSQHAPDLTHFASRGVFASGMFALYEEDGTVNRAALEAWLRDPPDELPMAADHQPYRGMPTLNLTEDQIDQLVAYLTSLGPKPPTSSEERR